MFLISNSNKIFLSYLPFLIFIFFSFSANNLLDQLVNKKIKMNQINKRKSFKIINEQCNGQVS